jgi:hypothetical protein
MRQIQYISPTAYQKWRADREQYYMDYLADSRPEREPQTIPMSIGSAFDAYAKSEINKALGLGSAELEFDALFERGVEPHLRDQARADGMVAFQLYKSSGALADLLGVIAGDVSMEFEVMGTAFKKSDGVILMGKPDLCFTHKSGAKVLLDWKVNGAYSKYNVSPMKGYLKIRNSNGSMAQSHKECVRGMWNGVPINVGGTLEGYNDVWAAQLAVYAWLCGMEVGSDFIVMIDQVAGKLGDQRIAEHRCLVGRTFQQLLYQELKEMWEIVHSEHIFRDLTLEDSKARCKLLDGMAFSTPEDDIFNSVKHRVFYGI